MNKAKEIDMKLNQDKLNKEIIEDIYDIIFETKFQDEAKRRFKKRWFNKEVMVDLTRNKEKYIQIGEKYKLTLSIIKKGI